MKKLLFLSLLAFAACKKTDDTPDLPGPSSTGQNYLACKVNGEVRIVSGLDNWNRRNGVGYSRFIDKITFGGDDDGRNDDLGIYLYMPPDFVKANISYKLGGETSENVAKYFF